MRRSENIKQYHRQDITFRMLLVHYLSAMNASLARNFNVDDNKNKSHHGFYPNPPICTLWDRQIKTELLQGPVSAMTIKAYQQIVE